MKYGHGGATRSGAAASTPSNPARTRPGFSETPRTRARSPGSTNGASTARPSSRASPSPPYTSFSTVISKSLRIKITPSNPPTMRARVFSGMQPSGNLHIGNYLGALKNWVRVQADYECIFCIVDLHAELVEVGGVSLAAGLGPRESSIMVQSAVAAHAELAWMLPCVPPVGWLERM